MLQIDFSSNPNGKLFNDSFGDIRLFSQAFQIGTECEISFRRQFMGYAKIEEIKTFPFFVLSNVDSVLNCGKPRPYQARLLSTYYNGGKMLGADAKLQTIVFTWTERKEAQEILMKDWWQSKQVYKNVTN